MVTTTPLHPIHHPDADVGARWLALSAWQRTRRDELEIAAALEALPFQGRPKMIDESQVWRAVR